MSDDSLINSISTSVTSSIIDKVCSISPILFKNRNGKIDINVDHFDFLKRNHNGNIGYQLVTFPWPTGRNRKSNKNKLKNKRYIKKTKTKKLKVENTKRRQNTKIKQNTKRRQNTKIKQNTKKNKIRI